MRIPRQSFLRHDRFPAFPARVPVETQSLHESPLLVWDTKHSGECLQPHDDTRVGGGFDILIADAGSM